MFCYPTNFCYVKTVGFCKWEHFVQRETEFDWNKGFTGKSFEYYKEKYNL